MGEKPMGEPVDLSKVGRLALRQEGDLWVAYYAPPDTMEGATYLGSIHLALVATPARKAGYIDLMREIVADIIESMYGARPTWGQTEPAPASERGAQVPNAFLR